MLGYNIQNLLILYLLNLMCLIQWIKFLLKKFLELTYYWFHIQYDEKFFLIILNEIYNTIISIFSININIFHINKIIILSHNIYMSNEINIWKFI